MKPINRREFLSLAAGGVVGSMLPSCLRQDTQPAKGRSAGNYGLAANMLGSMPRTEALAEIAGTGFMAVELSVGKGTFGDWTTDPESMRRDIERAGLIPWSVHSPNSGWDLASDSEEARLAAVSATLSCLRPARDVGANVVVCHPNDPTSPFPADDYSASMARSRKSLETLADEARRVGIRLAVETMIPRKGKRPFTRVAEILQLIEPLGEHVGICLDTGHNNATGANVSEEAVLAGKNLYNVHIQDNHGRPNEDEHLLPGEGTIDWRGFIDALDRIKFISPRIIEVGLLKGPDAPRRTMQQLGRILRTWQA